MEYQRDEHRVHLIVYHLIWCPKRRKSVLVGDVAEDCHAFIAEKCAEKGWDILELAIQPDHVHLFVRVWPSDSAAVAGYFQRGAEKMPGVIRPHVLRDVRLLSMLASTAECGAP